MTAEDIIALARTQIGTSENPPGSNSVKYNQIYYGNDTRLPWCVVFIWWLFKELGASDLFCGGQKTAHCDFVADYARTHNQWVTGNYKAGDLVLFQWDSGELDHIGLVVEVNGNAVTTIEGNCDDKVSQLTRSGIAMVGAYRPKYVAKESEPHSTPVNQDKEPVKGGRYTVQRGDTLWGIAEKVYGAGQGWRCAQIMSANNLITDMIHPGQVLVIPDGSQTTVYRTIQITVKSETLELLTIMADGGNKTVGQVIDTLMEDAV